MRFTFKAFRGDKATAQDEETLNPKQRRREQVRRAQKTHRERKEAYTASLEAEVVQLRANEARILQETKMLYAENSLLKRWLTENGVGLPTSAQGNQTMPREIPDAAPEDILTLNIGQKGKQKNQRKQIYIQKRSEVQQRLDSQEGDVILPDAVFSPQSDSTAVDYSPVSTQSTTYLSELDPTIVGMDFVLTLESPCLAHNDVDGSSFGPAPSTGHALTVSACVLHHHHSAAGQRLDSSAPWNMSRAGIERLLELSQDISLSDGEMTPVQAWAYIRQHARYTSFDSAWLESLKEKLLGFVKCYGFGGVIDQYVFEDTVGAALDAIRI